VTKEHTPTPKAKHTCNQASSFFQPIQTQNESYKKVNFNELILDLEDLKTPAVPRPPAND
jgi:hypothetical protein